MSKAYLRSVPNWSTESDRRRAAMMLRNTVLAGVSASILAKAMNVAIFRAEDIMAGRKAPTIHQLHDLKTFAKTVRDDLRRAVQGSDEFFADDTLDRLVMSER